MTRSKKRLKSSVRDRIQKENGTKTRRSRLRHRKNVRGFSERKCSRRKYGYL